MSHAPLDRAAEQAITWMVRLRAGTPSAQQRARFDSWLASDPAHQQAWAQLQRGLGSHFDVVRQAPERLRDSLLHAESSRRDVLRGLVGLGMLGSGLWLAAGSDQGRVLLADLRTGIGERRSLALPDGSRLSLNADSSVDVDFSARHRLLHLHQGSLLVQAAADPLRPLVVRTAQGEAKALGTRFMVERQADSTRVLVLEHAVRVSLPGGQGLELQAGQCADLYPARIERLPGDQRFRADWQQGRLSVFDEPLEAVIDALRPYRRGLIRVAPQVRHLHVQGVFALDDSERTLTALAETLPLSVEHYGPWLTLIGPRS
ncbi:iron dicitrate transport regulator FecR [Pseudomonas sp. PA15(2017)]|uniref:FecR domain-containing protein n=1 Tax=Pseudomonas sp. PA15(2017) TaxID=1932111 RepID=UPI00095CB78D|nr:FecR family protein [Pseudomonas sp. PA15(2017)]OLU30281.1 iron dicitrate transport regulator FecR [Pseudomonas sp. PA15(2017)]